MDIYLIRHADPHPETALTEDGFRQAERLADYLRAVPITHVYTSPLARARKTMEVALAGRDLEPVTLDWLQELRGDIGIGHSTWTTTGAELEANPALAARVEEHMTPQLHEVTQGFDALLREQGFHREGRAFRYDGGPDGDSAVLAVFAHGGLIQTLLAGLLRMPLPDFYAAVHYRCTGITHLTMMRRRDGPPELQMLSFCARPHLGVEGHFER
jgi:probable phosphoglycerate mutase